MSKKTIFKKVKKPAKKNLSDLSKISKKSVNKIVNKINSKNVQKTVSKTSQIRGIRIAQPFSQPVQRKELSYQDTKEIEDELRDIINWIAVFEQEYDIPAEVVETLLKKLHNVAKKVGWLHCH